MVVYQGARHGSLPTRCPPSLSLAPPSSAGQVEGVLRQYAPLQAVHLDEDWTCAVDDAPLSETKQICFLEYAKKEVRAAGTRGPCVRVGMVTRGCGLPFASAAGLWIVLCVFSHRMYACFTCTPLPCGISLHHLPTLPCPAHVPSSWRPMH